MTIRTTRPSFVAPHALVFVFLMNTGAVAAFQWTRAAERAGADVADMVTFARADGRTPVGGCGIVRPAALAIRPAPAVPKQDSVQVSLVRPRGAAGVQQVLRPDL